MSSPFPVNTQHCPSFYNFHSLLLNYQIDDPDDDPNKPPYHCDDSDLYDVWTPKAPPYSPITPPYSPITPRSASPMSPISRFPSPEPRSPSPTPRSPSPTQHECQRPDFYDEDLASPYNGSHLSEAHVDEGYDSPTNGGDNAGDQEEDDGFEDEGYFEREDPSQLTQAEFDEGIDEVYGPG